MRNYGAQSMVEPLRRVLVRRPDAAFGGADPARWHYVSQPDLEAARIEHDALAARAIALVEVPAEEYPTMGPNVLALAPRRRLALEGNPVTRRRMEAAGCEVLTYRGREISLEAEGGPTCLTRPVLRSM